jgi:hypothetical protein
MGCRAAVGEVVLNLSARLYRSLESDKYGDWFTRFGPDPVLELCERFEAEAFAFIESEVRRLVQEDDQDDDQDDDDDL